MMPARLAPSVCQAKRASSGPCCRSLGHTRNTYGLIHDRSGLDADGEIIGVGVAPPPYTRAAEREGPELRCPTTATIAGSHTAAPPPAPQRPRCPNHRRLA